MRLMQQLMDDWKHLSTLVYALHCNLKCSLSFLGFEATRCSIFNFKIMTTGVEMVISDSNLSSLDSVFSQFVYHLPS